MGNFDLRAAGTHPIRFADTRRGLTCIRYNHKPAVSEDLATATIRRGTKKGDYKLSIKDDQDEFVYQGRAGNGHDMVVLVVDESGDGLVLETPDASIACNLIEAPWESDQKKLAEQYPMLLADGSNQAEATDAGSQLDTSDDSDPDPNNPFDFRNYIGVFNTAPVNAKPHIAERNSPAVSTTSTPRKPPTSDAVRKPTNPMLPNQRKTKTRAQAATTTAPASRRRKSPPPAAPVAIPEVRVSSSTTSNGARKSRPAVEDIELDLDIDDSHDDDGDLIFDDAPPKPAKHSTHLRAAADVGGPISLRSAASSPGSHVASPAGAGGYRHPPATTPQDDDELLIDQEPSDLRRTRDPDSDDNHAEAVPQQPTRTSQSAQQRRRSSGIAAPEAEDEDAELEAEMEAAMLRELAMQEDDENDEQHVTGTQQSRYVEEEEESEEE